MNRPLQTEQGLSSLKMEQIEELHNHLRVHVSQPQASERWALYRLITPLVDYANLTLMATPYFEYNQTSEHGRQQAVDIAMLGGDGEPLVLIEAKRWDRAISSEQIAKYMQADGRGVVSSGGLWVLCQGPKSVCLSLLDAETGEYNPNCTEAVVKFIRGEETGLQFSQDTKMYKVHVKPNRPTKKRVAIRRVHTKTVAMGAEDLYSFLKNRPKPQPLENAFVAALADHFGTVGLPSDLRVEMRSTRISFFDLRKTTGSQRLGRIELGKNNPDILVLTNIVNSYPELIEISPAYIHDKGAHMRRFRLRDVNESKIFGTKLGQILTDEYGD